MTDEERSKVCVECGNCCKFIAITSNGENASFMAAWGYELKPIVGRGEFTATLYHPCQHLTPDGCDIYETRPKLCREYFACNDPAMAHLCKLKPFNKEAQ
jgi:Fe-S-cluster containining protein